MSNNAITFEKTIHNVSNDIRDRAIDIAAKVKADAVDAKDAVSDALERQCENAADGLRKFSRKATRFYRRHPAQSFAAALAVGFLIGRFHGRR